MFLQVLCLFIFNCFTFADDKLSPLLSYDINVKESIFSINGTRYRKVEYQGDIFYLKLLEVDASATELQLKCGQDSGDLGLQNQIHISTKITKRSSLFIDGLRQTCSDLKNGKKMVEVNSNIRIGFTFDDKPGDLLKNKKIFIMPITHSLGFYGEW